MKKKLLLVVLTLAIFTLAVAGCSIIGKDKNDHVHTGGEATCLVEARCTDCGELYGELAPHTYNDATCLAPKICTVCRHTEGSKGDHRWQEATCKDPKTCLDCGSTEGTVTNDHTKGDTILKNDTSHWYGCTVCDAKLDEASHTGGEANCKKQAECEVCGTAYGNLGDHTWKDPDCYNPGQCTTCNSFNAAPLGHTCEEYSYDAEYHWYVCTRCGKTYDKEAHSGGVATSTEQATCQKCETKYGELNDIVVNWTTESLYPTEDSTVILADPTIYEWFIGYNMETTDTDAHWLAEDRFKPVPVSFRWSVGEKARYYKLYVSRNSDMSGADCYLTNNELCEVDYLFADTEYFWRVDAVYENYTVRSKVFTFRTTPTPRTVFIEGVSNSRDIGGYLTEDGYRIKQGMVYRSAKLDDITEYGKYTLLNILGIKTDLDLRGYSETPPISELNYIATACPWYATGSNHIYMNDYNKAELAKTIKVFADEDNYPIIFHCSLGRDRTGTVALLLEGLLGVDENTLIMEYELSVFSYWGCNGSTKFNNGLRTQISDTYDYINDNYEGDSFSERVEAFLIDIGVTAEEIASIRELMLEEVAYD